VAFLHGDEEPRARRGGLLVPVRELWTLRARSAAKLPRVDLEPPLEFAEDRAFDLVYAYSVFTHIPLELQPAWLDEMRRILRPDGFFLCTVLGESTRRQMLGPGELAELRRTGHLTLTSSDRRASLSTQAGGSGWDVFQTRAEIIRVFGSVFRIRDYVPASQDLLILQRPA
jgi:SAM-dependent methyltransferase